MKKMSSIICLSSLMVFLAVTATAQSSDASMTTPASQQPNQYDINFWDESSALQQSRIRAVAQTRDGYLWLGSDNGLIRFDGAGFTTFGVQTGDLKDNEVSSLAEDGAGNLWIGTLGGGLTCLKQGRFTTYTTADGLPDDMIGQLDRDSEGAIWFTTANGVGRYAQGRFTTFTVKDGLPDNNMTTLCARSRQGVFVGVENQVFRYTRGRFESVAGITTAQEDWVDCLAGGRDGALLVFLKKGGIHRLKDQNWTTQSLGQDVRATHAYEDPAGTLWISSRAGLFKAIPGKLEPLFAPDIQTRMGTVNAICGDAEGNLWAGLETNGLARIRKNQLSSISRETGLPDGRILALLQDSRGGLWFGMNEGLVSCRDGRITRYAQNGSNTPYIVTAIAEAPDGKLWVGSGRMLYHLEGGRLVQDPAWIKSGDIRVIYHDPLGPMWIGTDGGGLFEMNGGKTRNYLARDGLANPRIRDIHRDRHGALWIATMGGGVSRLAGGKFTCFTDKEGLGSNRVVALHEDSEGKLWAATRGGLSLFQDGRFLNFGPREGIQCIFVHSIQSDDQGGLWLGSAQGLFRILKSDLEALAAGRIKQVSSKHYGTAEGMKALACSVGNQPLACRTRDGRLLFATLRGAAVVDPRMLTVNKQPPPVHIENVKSDGQALPSGQQAIIPPGRGTVEIRYAAFSFINPERVLFKYRLEGFDDRWVDAGTRRFAYYAGLPPGQYRFQVIACNADGTWNTRGDSFAFTLQPHFYQTGWFYALCALAALLLAYVAHDLRVRRHKAHERELQHRVEEALAKVKVLSGMLPICAHCKKVRDDKGYWNSIEKYISEHSDTMISHGICPDCVKALYPEYAEELLKHG